MSASKPNELQELILAAMLHDLGKFGQRAGAERSDSLISSYCPSYQGRSSHLHVLNTDHFIENLLPIPGDLGLDRSAIAKLAANHHKPDWNDLRESCLVLADHLASGADRWKSDEDEEVGEDFINSRLISIFNEPELGKNTFIPDQAGRYRQDPDRPRWARPRPEQAPPFDGGRADREDGQPRWRVRVQGAG